MFDRNLEAIDIWFNWKVKGHITRDDEILHLACVKRQLTLSQKTQTVQKPQVLRLKLNSKAPVYVRDLGVFAA